MLEGGRDDLAREAAQAIANIEAERDAAMTARTLFATEITRLKRHVGNDHGGWIHFVRQGGLVADLLQVAQIPREGPAAFRLDDLEGHVLLFRMQHRKVVDEAGEDGDPVRGMRIAQVGPQLAELLGLPDLTHAVALQLRDRTIEARCQVADGQVTYASDLPALVTFDREANVPRLPTMTGIMKAARAGVVRWTAADLGVDTDTIGLKGSPTQMLNIFTPPVGRKGEILQGPPNETVGRLIDKLRAERLLR